MNNATPLTILVQASGHCNLDSLPLRFGFSFNVDTTIKLLPTSTLESDKKFKDRFSFNANLIHPTTGEALDGHFIVTQKGKNYILVTAWRHDSSTEYYLSSVMRDLRQSGDLTTDKLIALHELYANGDLRNHSDLVRELSKSKSENEVFLLKLHARNSVLALEQQLKQSEKQVDTLEKMLTQVQQELENERNLARQKGSHVEVAEPTTLVSVETNIIHRGSPCTILTLANGNKWYMKTSTFDPNGIVTTKAKSLIGQQVRVTSWDPVQQPGKWSKQGYFRNIYPVA